MSETAPEPATVESDPRSNATDPIDRADQSGGADDADRAALAAQLEVLAEENRRLRAEFARARKARYRRTALWLVVLGVLATLAGVAFPDARTVLFALGGTGLFTGVLTYYLTPERFLAAAVGRDVYAALAANQDALVDELGLQETATYVPRKGAGDPPAWLFVPQRSEYDLPDEAIESLFVVTDAERSRGVSFRPSGAPLYAEFERALADELADGPERLAAQLADGLVEQFELVAGTTIDVDPEGDRVSVGITGSAYGPLDRFDHPVSSFLGVGFACGLDTPVTVETTPGDDRVDALVTCRWSAD